MSAESDFNPVDQEPTRALLLAQALEMCIQAEREVPGSADRLIAHQPAWARGELRRLISLAGSLDAAATSAVMSEEFRVSARARLMRRVSAGQLPAAAESPQGRTNGHSLENGPWLTTLRIPERAVGGQRRRARWLRRGIVGGLLAVALVIAATLTASASALPGEPLYSVKQAREAIGLRLAPDDQARAFLLLNQADTRLSETQRLLQEGRTDQAAHTTQCFDDALSKATATYIVTISASTSASTAADTTTASVESQLAEQQDQLQTMLATAPEPARPDLREALVATVRSRALVADPKRDGTDASSPTQLAAAPVATATPAPVATEVPHVSSPPPVDLIADAPAVEQHTNHADDDANVSEQPTVTNVNRPPSGGRHANRGPSSGADQQANAVEAMPPQPIASAEQAAAPDDGHDDHANVPAPQPSPTAVAPRLALASQAPADDHAHDVAPQPTPVPLTHAATPAPAHSDANSNRSASVVAAKPTVTTTVTTSTQTPHDGGTNHTQTAPTSSDDHHGDSTSASSTSSGSSGSSGRSGGGSSSSGGRGGGGSFGGGGGGGRSGR